MKPYLKGEVGVSKNAIFYTVSGKHVTLTATSLYSLIKHYDIAEPLEVRIYHDNVYPADLAALVALPALMNKPQITIQLAEPPSFIDAVQYEDDRFPKVVLWRLFVPSLLNDYDHLVYLDNDTLVYGNIAQLFDLVPENRAFGAVRDYYIHIEATNPKSVTFGQAESLDYVNSGVLAFNVAKYNEIISPNDIVEFIAKNPNVNYADQTALNKLGAGQIEFLPYRFNDQKSNHWLRDFAEHENPDFVQDVLKERNFEVVRHFIEFVPNDMPWEHLVTDDVYEDDFWSALTAMKKLIIKHSQSQRTD